jgi:hypothetical protein
VLLGQRSAKCSREEIINNEYNINNINNNNNNNNNSVALVLERTIPTERQPLVGEVSANLC